jgi:hypothetical protein
MNGKWENPRIINSQFPIGSDPPFRKRIQSVVVAVVLVVVGEQKHREGGLYAMILENFSQECNAGMAIFWNVWVVV